MTLREASDNTVLGLFTKRNHHKNLTRGTPSESKGQGF